MLNIIGNVLISCMLVSCVYMVKHVVEIIVTAVDSFVAPVVYDVATSFATTAYASINSYDITHYMNDVPVFFNCIVDSDSDEVAATIDTVVSDNANVVDVFVPCKGVRKTLGYNDRNDGFCRTLFSRSKTNRSRITKEGKVQRIKPNWKYIDIDDTDIYED